MVTASDVVSGVRISEVIHALTGKEPRRTGGSIFRTAATWRGGDGLSVAGDDARGVWHDFVTGEGGGVLDLVQRVRGESRQDALRWVADFAGLALDEKKPSPDLRAEWAKRRRELEQFLPDARYWQRAAVNMAENCLAVLKGRLFDPTPEPEDLSEPVQLPGDGIFEVEQTLSRIRALDGAALIEEYRWWFERYPGMTGAMVRAAKARERAERRAVLTYLRLSKSQKDAA